MGCSLILYGTKKIPETERFEVEIRILDSSQLTTLIRNGVGHDHRLL